MEEELAPQRPQKRRLTTGDDRYSRSASAPCVIVTPSARVDAKVAKAEPWLFRHREQWQ
jgi:hypothetical protein